MKKILLLLLFPIAITLSGCAGSFVDVLNATDEAALKQACSDRTGYNTFKNRVNATTKSVEGKVEAAKILVGPATLPFAGIEGLGVGAINIYNGFFNSEQSQAADKRCEGIE